MIVEEVTMGTETEVEDFLAHYGVKGMRWGVRKQRKAYKQYKEKMYGNKKKKKLTQAQKDMRKIRTIGRVSTGVYVATRGYQFLLSPSGQRLMSKSGKAYQKTFHPSVEDKIRKYIREGPPPKDFIDVGLSNKLIPRRP